jgi:hypothetical protein
VRDGMITSEFWQILLQKSKVASARIFGEIRGTAMLFDEKSGIVYLKGTVPYFQVYPGAYIPRAIEFIREEGETNAADLAREIVGLSELNFNNTQFDTGDPITVRAARRVGDILKHVPEGKKVNSRFRYFT